MQGCFDYTRCHADAQRAAATEAAAAAFEEQQAAAIRSKAAQGMASGFMKLSLSSKVQADLLAAPLLLRFPWRHGRQIEGKGVTCLYMCHETIVL